MFIKNGKNALSKLVLSLVLLAMAIPMQAAQAAPDTDYTNKVNFDNDTMYQIFTDRFVDGNSLNNPSDPNMFTSTCTNTKKYCGGDYKGIQNKIEDNYFTNLGITALWITSPVEQLLVPAVYSGVPNAAYHGYWGRDFKKSNQYFGTMTDFTNLVTAAHLKHIKVVIDFAPNHTSPASTSDTSFADNGGLYNNGVLMAKYNTDPNLYFHHNGGIDPNWFADHNIYQNLFDLADLNQHNPTIDQYLKDSIKVWLDAGIDGIRMDAVKHMSLGWQKSFLDFIYEYKPVYVFGEWAMGTNEDDPQNPYFANESNMGLLDFRFGRTVREVFRDNADTMISLDGVITSTNNAYNEVNDQVTFFDSHDMEDGRFSKTGNSTRLTDSALALTLTSRGIPNVYYGTEQYMMGGGDPDNRNKINTTFPTTNKAFTVIKNLSDLRKANPALAYGNTTQRWLNNDVYVYERKFGNSVVLTAINRSTTSYNITGLITALPAATYTDVLAGTLDGNSITVGAGGAVTTFALGANEVGVWQYNGATTTANIGHVGPMMEIAGKTIRIDGRGFGATAGTVYFGATAVTGANIISWEDTSIQVNVPAVTPGLYDIKVRRSGSGVDSNIYDKFEVLTAKQVTVRFVMNGTTNVGEEFYLVGDKEELGSWAPAKATKMYNTVVLQYPNWYIDLSVPANTTVSFKVIKKNYGAGIMNWESGANHTFLTPAGGVGTGTATTATFNVNGWDSSVPVQ